MEAQQVLELIIGNSGGMVVSGLLFWLFWQGKAEILKEREETAKERERYIKSLEEEIAELRQHIQDNSEAPTRRVRPRVSA